MGKVSFRKIKELAYKSAIAINSEIDKGVFRPERWKRKAKKLYTVEGYSADWLAKIKPDLAEANYGLAICYNKLGQVTDEIRAYKKALAAEPNMVAALANLGNAYFGQQKYDAAIGQYKKAIRIRPDDGTIHYNLAAAYFNKTNYELAWKHIKIAEELGAEIAEDLLNAIENKLQ